MKKLLIISHNAMSLHANNGKTLASIFGGWLPGRLAQLYFNFEIPDAVCCNNYYRLNEIDVLTTKLGGGNVVFPAGAVGENKAGFFKKIFSRTLCFIKSNKNFKLLFRDFFFALGFWDSNKLDAWIREFSPECVFFLGGESVFSFYVTLKISRRYDLPLFIYLTDDYVLNDVGSGLARMMQKRRKGVYRFAFAFARHVFVIGTEMAKAYKKEFGRDFFPVMNCVDNVPDLSEIDFSRFDSCCVDVVYVGGLHLGRSDSIVLFSRALHDAFSSVGLNCVLSVYSTQKPDHDILEKFDNSGVAYCGALSQGEVMPRLKSAHYVLHVESFDEEFIEATKYSVSTKISEYLSSGALVIGFGPSVVASIKLLTDNSLGIVFTENSSANEIADDLLGTYLSRQNREFYINNSLEFARNNFLADRVRGELYSLINY